MSTKYQQRYKIWRYKYYPTKKYNVGRSGCGLCSVVNLATNNPVYADLTPLTARPFMVKYAEAGHGTLWKGIVKGLQHYGFNAKVLNSKNLYGKKNTSCEKTWKKLISGGQMGVLLMGKSYWAAKGHYIAVDNHKVVDGVDYYHIINSSSTKKAGWYDWTTFSGKVKAFFVGELIPIRQFPIYPDGAVSKSQGTKSDIIKWQKFLMWYFDLETSSVDGDFGSRTRSRTIEFQKQVFADPKEWDGIAGKKTIAKAKEAKKG